MNYFLFNSLCPNDLGLDAWGRPKMITDKSLFHGMFTYNVPVSTWYETINDVVQTGFTNSTSEDGALKVVAGASLNDDTYLRSFRNPRYEPNRGALYSTAGWFVNPTANMVREFGTFTAESGVFFRLKADGKLYGVIRTTTTGEGTIETEIKLDVQGEIDFSKGNVFDIQYQWRGVGNYRWFVNLVEVGNSRTLGTLTRLSMWNPALPVAFQSTNLGDNDPMYFGCVDVSSEGGEQNGLTYASFGNSTDNGQAAYTGLNVPVIAVRSKSTVGGKINTRDTAALLANFYANQEAVARIWATRDFSAITEGNSAWEDITDGHLEGIQRAATAGTLAFDTAKAQLVFSSRVESGGTVESTALFQNRTAIYLTPGDMFVFTLHRINGAIGEGGATFEFAEQI